MWEINNTLQIINFMRSILFGTLLCLLYDFLRAFRKTHSYGVITVFIQDVVFSVLIAVLTFIFLLSITNGDPRGFVFVAAIIGFVLCRYTLSRIFLKFLVAIIGGFKKFLLVFTKYFYAFFEKCEKNIKKLPKNLKKDKKNLKTDDDILYTIE